MRNRRNTGWPRRAIVSPRAYAWLLGDPWLRRAIIPGGLLSAPYEILNYQSVLTLHNPEGTRATFARQQVIRFVQDGVSAILDHAWGDGLVFTQYVNEAGRLEGSYDDAGYHHLVVALTHQVHRGDVLDFRVSRDAMVGFTRGEEWLETTVDHPIARLAPSVVFPKERPCRRAVLQVGTRCTPLPVRRRRDGRIVVRAEIPSPRANVPYTIRWRW